MSKYADYVFSKKTGVTYGEMLKTEKGRDDIRWQLTTDYLQDTSKEWKIGLVKWLKDQLELSPNDVSTSENPSQSVNQPITQQVDVEKLIQAICIIDKKINIVISHLGLEDKLEAIVWDD